jgi:hypothetical protein
VAYRHRLQASIRSFRSRLGYDQIYQANTAMTTNLQGSI